MKKEKRGKGEGREKKGKENEIKMNIDMCNKYNTAKICSNQKRQLVIKKEEIKNKNE